MTHAQKPTCFVAMAFDHDDTDELYDRQILPTLRALGVKAVRIDRRQSNDDINIQIIEQLHDCDFCIADLTYARPSVYYEAGFAQRAGTVIYTVRRDHLSSNQDDVRVHFDLQMKPIIPWKEAGDVTFAKRLRTRLASTVLKQWTQTRVQQAMTDKEKSAFGDLPLSERLAGLRFQAIYTLQRAGVRRSSYRLVPGLSPGYDDWMLAKKHLFDGRFNYLQGATLKGSRGLTVSIQSFDSVTETELRKMDHYYLDPWRFGGSFRTTPWDRIHTLHIHVFIMNLRPLASSKIERAFNHCHPLEKGKTYQSLATMGGESRDVDFTFKLHVLSGIESFAETKAWLEDVIGRYMPKNMRGGVPATLDKGGQIAR